MWESGGVFRPVFHRHYGPDVPATVGERLRVSAETTRMCGKKYNCRSRAIRSGLPIHFTPRRAFDGFPLYSVSNRRGDLCPAKASEFPRVDGVISGRGRRALSIRYLNSLNRRSPVPIDWLGRRVELPERFGGSEHRFVKKSHRDN